MREAINTCLDTRLRDHLKCIRPNYLLHCVKHNAHTPADGSASGKSRRWPGADGGAGGWVNSRVDEAESLKTERLKFLAAAALKGLLSAICTLYSCSVCQI